MRFLRQHGYELLDDPPLGEGSYAKVRRAYSRKMKLHVAVKIVDRKKAPDDFLKRFLPRELSIIQSLEHPRIIRVHEVLDIGDKVFVVMDIAAGGDLLDYIKTNGFVKETLSKKVFQQMLQAVKYCHKNGVLHRDLKCENILLDEGINVKITDFGFAKQFNKSELCKTFCGSAAYAAYEILKGNTVHFMRCTPSRCKFGQFDSHDIFIAGVVLGPVVSQSTIKLIQDWHEVWFQFCNILVRFSVYILLLISTNNSRKKRN